MTSTQAERRPAENGTGALKNLAAAPKSTTGCALGSRPEVFTLDDLDDMAEHAGGAFVVMIELTGAGADDEPRYRRRVFLTAAAAERAARAAQARGVNSRVYLAELVPLWRVVGGAR